MVTGSTKGIGRGVAEVIASEGATTIVTGRTVAAGQAVKKEIADRGGSVAFIPADLTQEDQVEALASQVFERYGRLDGLVNNAAAVDQIASWEAPITELPLENWNSFLESNLTSVFLASKHCMRRMLEAGNGGSVVNISSIIGYRGGQGWTGYPTTKGGIIALTKSVAAYYGRYDIRCNTLTIGWIQKPEDSTPERAKALEQFNFAPYQLGLSGEASDCGWAAVYLLSDESKFITATNLPIDGGWSELVHAPNPRGGRDLPEYKRKRPAAPEF